MIARLAYKLGMVLIGWSAARPVKHRVPRRPSTDVLQEAPIVAGAPLTEEALSMVWTAAPAEPTPPLVEKAPVGSLQERLEAANKWG